MKNLIRIVLVLFLTGLSSSVNADFDPKDDSNYIVYTVKELREIYGIENVEKLCNVELSENEVVLILASPCNGEMPCGGALAKARQEAQKLANECCCIRFYGVICCDPQNGALLAIDAIATPTNCN